MVVYSLPLSNQILKRDEESLNHFLSFSKVVRRFSFRIKGLVLQLFGAMLSSFNPAFRISNFSSYTNRP